MKLHRQASDWPLSVFLSFPSVKWQCAAWQFSVKSVPQCGDVWSLVKSCRHYLRSTPGPPIRIVSISSTELVALVNSVTAGLLTLHQLLTPIFCLSLLWAPHSILQDSHSVHCGSSEIFIVHFLADVLSHFLHATAATYPGLLLFGETAIWNLKAELIALYETQAGYFSTSFESCLKNVRM